jgi:hypothetical protein
MKEKLLLSSPGTDLVEAGLRTGIVLGDTTLILDPITRSIFHHSVGATQEDGYSRPKNIFDITPSLLMNGSRRLQCI